MNTFSISEVLGTGWKITKERFWFLAGALLIMIVVGNIPAILGEIMGVENSSALRFLQYVLNIFLEMGMIRIALNLLDGKEVSYNAFWTGRDKFLPFWGASILFGLMMLLGLVLLIVPGIIVFLTYGFFAYFLIDKGAGIIESLKMSAAMTKGNRWNLFGFIILTGLLNIAGALLLGIGLLWTAPTTTIAFAAIYRKLSGDLTPMVIPATPAALSTT